MLESIGLWILAIIITSIFAWLIDDAIPGFFETWSAGKDAIKASFGHQKKNKLSDEERLIKMVEKNPDKFPPRSQRW